jgi:hypothetical protein
MRHAPRCPYLHRLKEEPTRKEDESKREYRDSSKEVLVGCFIGMTLGRAPVQNVIL